MITKAQSKILLYLIENSNFYLTLWISQTDDKNMEKRFVESADAVKSYIKSLTEPGAPIISTVIDTETADSAPPGGFRVLKGRRTWKVKLDQNVDAG